MINYKKYELMKECLSETFEVYAATLDVSDYVPKEHLDKTHKWIYKVMRKKQRELNKEDRKYQRTLKKLIKLGRVINTTSKEYVLEDIDPSYINFCRVPSLMSETSIDLTENKIVENAVPSENVTPAENSALTENINGGECNVEKREEK